MSHSNYSQLFTSRQRLRWSYAGLVPLVVLLFVGGLLWGLDASVSAAPVADVAVAERQAIFYVTNNGSGSVCSQGSPCGLQTAVLLAIGGDEVRVAGGTYALTTTVVLNGDVVLRGGYDSSNWAQAPDPTINETRLDGQSTLRVMALSTPISPTIEGFTFLNGVASVGAAFRNVSSGRPTLLNNVFRDNTASGGAGGAIHDAGSAIIRDNVFYQNVASTGGAIQVENNGNGGNTQILFNEIYDNDAATSGGGINVWNGDAFIEGNSIYGNMAGFGGGLYMLDGTIDVTLQNNELYDNTATSNGGGVYQRSGALQAIHNTIAGNIATTEGGGVYVDLAAATALISNSIVISNVGGTSNNVYVDSGTVTGGYNNVPMGSNVVFTPTFTHDPNFVNWPAFNLHLAAGSLNISQADPQTPAAINIDIDQQARPNGAGYDIGADEYYPGTPAFSLQSVTADGFVERGTTAVVQFRLENTGNIADSYDVSCQNDEGWPITVCPATINNVDAGEGSNIDVTIDVPASAVGLTEGRTIVRVTSQLSPTLSQASVVALTILPGADLTFTPSYSSTLLPGEIFTFTHILTNTGETFDIFTVELIEEGWGELLPSDAFSLPLASGASQQVLLEVVVPTFAEAGLANTSVIEARSLFSATIAARVTDTITAKPAVGTRYVALNGNDEDNNCTQVDFPCLTIAHAVGQASFFDEIRVAAGGDVVYLEPEITLNSEVQISGGWIAGFNDQDKPSTTIVQSASGDTIFQISPGATVRPRVSNMTLQRGDGDFGGAITVGSFAQPQFSDLIVRENTALQGAAMYVAANALVDIENSFFYTNTSQSAGGGIYIDGGTVTLQKSRFSGNVANGNGSDEGGGGLYMASGLLFSENNLYVNNTAVSDGGAYYLESGQVTILHNTILSNTTNGEGGGIYNEGATVEVASTVFAYNIAAGIGGIFGDSETTLSYSDFWQNSAPEFSPAIVSSDLFFLEPGFRDGQYRLSSNSPLRDIGDPDSPLEEDFEADFRPSDQGFDIGYDELSGCIVRRGSETFGVIQEAIVNGDPDVLLIQISGICRGVNATQIGPNTVSQTVYITRPFTIEGSWNGNFTAQDPLAHPTFIDPQGAGRGFYIAGDGLTATIKSLIVRNGDATNLGGGPAAEDAGGGIYNDQSQTVFIDVSVYTSTAAVGGGLYNHTGVISVSSKYKSLEEPHLGGFKALGRFRNNDATHGGAVYNHDGDVTLEQVDIVLNQATLGGGVHNNLGVMTAQNARIRRNTAVDGGGLYNEAGVLDAINLILDTNSASSDGGGLYNNGDVGSVQHLTVYSNTAGSNGGGIASRGDTFIHSNLFESNRAASAPALFVFDSISTPDYNYYYDHATTPVVGVAVGDNSIVTNVIAPGLKKPRQGNFQLGDDAPGIDKGDPASPIDFDFEGELRPSNQSTDVGADEVLGCLVQVDDVIYGNLQDALDAADDGDEIRVAGRCSGVHEYDTGNINSVCGTNGIVETTFHIDKDVYVTGGWDSNFGGQNIDAVRSFLDAQGLGIALYVAAGSSPTIEGLDIIRGNATNGAGVCIEDASPRLYNNRIYSNTATNGSAIYSWQSLTLLDQGNKVRNNSSVNGSIYIRSTALVTTSIYNSFIYENVATNGGGIYNELGNAQLWHNTILSNTADSGGGFYIEGGTPSIRNNIVMGNIGLVEAGGAYGDVVPDIGYNDFFNNSSDFGGAIVDGGTGSISVDPEFVTIDGLPFGIVITSPVADKGDDTIPLLVDFEGDIRPSHQGPDMGADEDGDCFAQLASRPNFLYGSVQQAVDDAVNRDIVYIDGVCYGASRRTLPDSSSVAQGMFISKTLFIDGSFDLGAAAITGTINTLDQGRGLYVAAGAEVTITWMIFEDGITPEPILNRNRAFAPGDGGGGYNAGDLTLSKVRFLSNQAQNGGGFYNAGNLDMQEVFLHRNNATNGGGLYNSSANDAVVNIDGATIRLNTAVNGAGIYQSGGALFVNGNRIYKNVASGNGGGLYLSGGTAVTPDVWNNFVYLNQADGGGGLYNSNTNANIWHNTFVQNVHIGALGGGLYSNNNDVDIRSNIVDGNTGHGIYINNGSATIDYNNVINNGFDDDYGNFSDGDQNNIHETVAYVNAGAGDYHLFEFSAGVDEADPSLPDRDAGIVAYDIDGHMRPTNGGPDIGADELNLCLIRVDPTEAGGAVKIFSVFQEAIDYAELYTPLPIVEVARGACSGVKVNGNGTAQVGYIQRSLQFVGSLRRVDFGDANDYTSLEVGAVSSIISAEGEGRVLYIDPGAEPTFTHLSFVEGDALAAGDINSSDGGSVYKAGAGEVSFFESRICDSQAENGGGYYGEANSSMFFTGSGSGDCVVARVTEDVGGGIEFVEYRFYDGNRAVNGGNGGGIYSDGALLMINVSVDDNTAEGNGGGLYNNGDDAVLINAYVAFNEADGQGGGLYNSGSTLGIYHNDYIYNTAVGNGGGVRSATNGLIVNSTLFYSNTSTSGTGGGLNTQDSQVDLMTHNNFYQNFPNNSTTSDLGSNAISAFPYPNPYWHSPNIDRGDPSLQSYVGPTPVTVADDLAIRENRTAVNRDEIEALLDTLYKSPTAAPSPDVVKRSPEGAVFVEFDRNLVARPDGYNGGIAGIQYGQEHNGLHGRSGDIGSREYIKRFGCQLSPTQEKTITPISGQDVVVTYTVGAENYGSQFGIFLFGFTDTLKLSFNDDALFPWGEFNGGEVTLDWREAVQRVVTVTVPSSVTVGTQHVSTVLCASQSLGVTTTTQLVTNIGPVADLDITPKNQTAEAFPGEVLTFPYQITNRGNDENTVNIFASPGVRDAVVQMFEADGDVISGTDEVTLFPQQTITRLLQVRILDTAGATIAPDDVATPGIVVRSLTVPELEVAELVRITIKRLAGTRYVAPEGANTNNNCLVASSPCETINRAIVQAVATDEVRVSKGVYTDFSFRAVTSTTYIENVYIDKSIDIRGGYDVLDGFTTFSPITNMVTLDAERIRRVIYIEDGLDVSLSGLFLLDGSAAYDSSSDDPRRGGGIFSRADNLTISSTWFISNSARLGGGLFQLTGTLTVQNSVFANGLSYPNFDLDRGIGAGIYSQAGIARLENNTFVNNDVLRDPNPSFVPERSPQAAAGEAGAVFVQGNELVLVNNIFSENVADDFAAVLIDPSVAVVTTDYNLYYNHPVTATSFVVGPNSRTGNPTFIDDFYHIGPLSAAKDRGTSAVFTAIDFEGEARPQPAGTLYDIGADERVQRPSFTFEPTPLTATLNTGETAVFTHTLTNTGDNEDVYTITVASTSFAGGWSYTLTPTQTRLLSSTESTVVTLTVVAGLPGDISVSTITAVSGENGAARQVVDTVIVSSTAGVDIEASLFGVGIPGQSTQYTHILTNSGNGLDVFTLQVVQSTPDWTVTVVPSNTGVITIGGSIPFTVSVDVPAGTASGVMHQAVIEAVSDDLVTRDALTDTTTVTTTFALEIDPAVDSLTVPDGTTAVYNHTLTNLSNITDTVNITFTGAPPNWVVTVNPLTVPDLAPLDSVPLIVSVDVPTGTGGMSHVTMVTATLASRSDINATAVDTTIAAATADIAIGPDRQRIVQPNTVVTYTHTVTNLGNVTDTVSIVARSSQGWLTNVTAGPLTLGANQTATVVAVLNIPTGLPPGTQDSTVITATSGINIGVFDTATDISRLPQVHSLMFVPDRAATVPAGDTIVYTHYLTNSGSGEDTFAFAAMSSNGWPTQLSDTSVTLLPSTGTAVSVTLNVPFGTDGLVDTMLVTATSIISTSTSATVVDTTTVSGTLPQLAVDISPENAATAVPNETVVYAHTVTNIGEVADSYTITGTSSMGWVVTVSPLTTAQLAPSASEMVTVTVTVPNGSANGTVDLTSVAATSMANLSVFDVTTDTTTVSLSQTFGVDISPNNSGMADPGTTVSYGHTVSNLGSGADTFALTAESQYLWPTTVSMGTVVLGVGETADITVTIDVPLGADGFTDVTTVRAESVNEPTVFDTATDTTVVTGTAGVIDVEVSPDYTTNADPNDILQQVHTVQSNSSITQIFDLSVTSSRGWNVGVSPTSITLPPSGSETITVSIVVPSDATNGMIDRTTVAATSIVDPSVVGTAVDLTFVGEPIIYLPIVFTTPEDGGPTPTFTPTPDGPTPTFTPTPDGPTHTPTPSNTPTITPTPRPCNLNPPASANPLGIDLIVTNIQLSPSSPAAGQNTTVFVTIRNQGQQDVALGNNFFVDFYVNPSPEPPVNLQVGNVAWGVQGSDMTAGSSQTFSGNYVFSSGTHRLWAQVDTDNTVPTNGSEADEDNNVYGCLSVTVGGNLFFPEQQPGLNTEPRQTPTPPAAFGSEGLETAESPAPIAPGSSSLRNATATVTVTPRP